MIKMTRNLLVTAALLLITVSVKGQELSIKSFRLDENDASAVEHSRSDFNGNACALLKVILPVPGARFSGNIVGEASYHNGVYWVYQSSGTRMLQIRHNNYLALDVDVMAFGLRGMKGGKTYVLELEASAEASGKTQLVIQCLPKTAVVIVDSQPVASVNGVATKMVSEGHHKYVVTANGYKMNTGEVLIEAGQSRVVTVRLLSKDLEQMTPEELYEMGENLFMGNNAMSLNRPEAIIYYQEAAEKGHREAQTMLGNCYNYGYGVEVNPKMAAACYEKAAAQDVSQAQCRLGLLLLEGKGVSKNVKRAVELIRRAAEKGLPEALSRLAFMYDQGEGVKKDTIKAATLLSEAASLGDAYSMFMMGADYTFGKHGRPVDKAKGREWLQKSADLGFEASKRALREIDSKMVTLSIEPTEAKLFIDGEELFVGYGTAEIMLPRGEHTYRLEAPNYKTRTGTFTVGDEKVRLSLWLVPGQVSEGGN